MGPTSSNIAKFDVVQFRNGDKFVARAIGYLSASVGVHDPKAWVYLVEGSSTVDVINALEDLWNELYTSVDQEFKGTLALNS